MATDIPRVFISYSHDSPKHSEWVRKLATDLRSNGVDPFLDVWDIRPGQNFIQVIESAVAAAGHCIVVCTPRYREVAEKRRSDGVGYEGALIRDALSEKSAKYPWVVPIVRAGEGREALPDWLVDRAYLDLRDDKTYPQHFERLLRTIQSRRKALLAPADAAKSESGGKSETTLTINVDFKQFNESKLAKLSDLLKSYLGAGVTITEKKSG